MLPKGERWEEGGGRMGNVQLVNVRMEDAVDEADTGALVGILVGEFDVDFPQTTLEGSLVSCESTTLV